MRKIGLIAALMMTLLLSGCGGGEEQKALDAALTIRSEFLALPGFSTQAELTADYGQRVYDYTLDLSANEVETLLTVREPELVAGITARIRADSGFLEYDGLCLETGPLTDDGLTPLSAIPAMLDAVRGAYILSCGFEDDGTLRVDYGDPDATPDNGTCFTLRFDPEIHDPICGEVTSDGYLRITCTFSLFQRSQ